MTVTVQPYYKFALGLGTGQFDLSTDTIKVALTTVGYVPDIGAHEFYSDITNEVLSTGGTNYTTGGAALTGLTWSSPSPTVAPRLTADSVVWAAATFTARRAVIYQSTGTSTTSRLIGVVDFGANVSPANQDLILDLTAGVLFLAPEAT